AFLRNNQGDNVVAFRHFDTTDTTGRPTHRANLFFLEAHGFAGGGEQHDFGRTIGNGGADQGIPLIEIQGNQATAARTREVRQRSLLDHTGRGGHQHKLVFRVIPYRQEGGNTLTFVQRQDVHHGPATGAAAATGNLEIGRAHV